MNQILMTDNAPRDNNRNNFNNRNTMNNKNNRQSSTLEIKSIARIFAIVILVFGLILSGGSAYAMFQNIEDNKNAIQPVVTATKQSGLIVLDIETKNGVRTVSYNWNGGTEVKKAGQNKREVEVTTTEIPFGNSKLNITITDSTGKSFKYVKNYIKENDDITEPEIDFEVVDENIKIIVTDDVELDSATYQVGEDEAKTVYAEAGQTTLEILVPITRGQITINIEATDAAGNVATKNQEVKGATKPTIEVTADPNDLSYLIIKAHDVEGLRMVSFYINDQQYQTDPNVSLGTTDFEYRFQVQRGETKVIVHAYNVNEQVAEFDGVYNY